MQKLFLFILLLFAAPAFAGDDNELVRSVTVTGFAEAKLAPNQANLSMTVHSENTKLDVAKKEQDKKVKEMMNLIADIGIKEKDVKTRYANVQPVYDYMEKTNKPKFRHYALDNQVDININELEDAGPLMDKLVQAGFDRVNGLTFALKDDREQREALLVDALANAKDKAQKMVGALGAKLGKPITITESGSYNPPPMLYAKSARAEMAMASDTGGSMPTYSPAGLIEIQQTVNVTFGIE